MRSILTGRTTAFTLILAAFALTALAQEKPASKLVYYDHEGKQISNNEFVDIRVANFNYPDATIVKTLPDGTVEFRLQKVAQEGMAAPNISVRTIDGKTVSLAALRGKVVVLHFWFIGCPVCRSMKPKLNEFVTRFAGSEGVVFLAMTSDAEADVEKYFKKEPLNYINAAGAKAEMSRFAFSGFPKNIVIDKQGKIVYWRSTIAAWDKFESVVRSELAK
ncbi:MAG TPA: TlpA disulfide reductase family protein [Pyrinomonadaceae bacterium]|nr:TlpA disulfide reductase family protein [Pyrinomonadaceae bacterium]